VIRRKGGGRKGGVKGPNEGKKWFGHERVQAERRAKKREKKKKKAVHNRLGKGRNMMPGERRSLLRTWGEKRRTAARKGKGTLFTVAMKTRSTDP